MTLKTIRNCSVTIFVLGSPRDGAAAQLKMNHRCDLAAEPTTHSQHGLPMGPTHNHICGNDPAPKPETTTNFPVHTEPSTTKAKDPRPKN